MCIAKKRRLFTIHRYREAASMHGRGFTVAELLISLIILGILLTAAAVAFDASVTNFTANEDIFRAMNTARQALFRITSDLRTAQAVGLIPDDDVDNQQCSIQTANGDFLTYRYDANAGILYLDVNVGANVGSYILCEDVTAISFDRTTLADDPFAVKNVQITLTVTIDRISQTVSSAAVIRRNL